MAKLFRIGVVGDFNPEFHSHRNTNSAMRQAAEALSIEAEVEWVPTEDVTEARLERYDALWLSAGSPYRSLEGALAAVEFARRRDRPFTAT
jgi:CTP synthase (UTP-ammonia lyase)